jgi:hypothetical protein
MGYMLTPKDREWKWTVEERGCHPLDPEKQVEKCSDCRVIVCTSIFGCCPWPRCTEAAVFQGHRLDSISSELGGAMVIMNLKKSVKEELLSG